MRQPNQKRLVDRWNGRYPVGTPVTYWTGARRGEGEKSKTESAAQLLGGHTAVVWVEDHIACVALSHVDHRREG